MTTLVKDLSTDTLDNSSSLPLLPPNTGETLCPIAASYVLGEKIKESGWLQKQFIKHNIDFRSRSPFNPPAKIGNIELHADGKSIRWAFSHEIDRYIAATPSRGFTNFVSRTNYIRAHGRIDQLGLVEALEGEDRLQLLRKMDVYSNISAKKLYAAPNTTYPEGKFTRNHMLTFKAEPIIMVDGITYKWTKTIHVTDSSGNTCGVFAHYTDNSQIITIPYSVQERRPLQGYVCAHYDRYEFGLTNLIFGLYNRRQIKEAPTATILLTTTPYQADEINITLRTQGIKNLIATSWFGSFTSLKHSNWSYLTQRNVIVALPNISGIFSKAVHKKLANVSALSFEFVQDCEGALKQLAATTSTAEEKRLLLQNVTPYRSKIIKEKKEAPTNKLLNQLKNKVRRTQELAASCVENQATTTWNDIIRPDSLTLCCGPTEVGKTMFLYGLANAIANNASFLNIKSTKNKKILYIDAETAEREGVNRSKRIQQALPNATESVEIIFTRNLDSPLCFDQPDHLQEITSGLEEYDVVVFDNLLSLANKTVRTARLWEKFARWCNHLNTAVVLVHHENKEGGVLGITEIQALTPTIIQLSKDNSDPAFLGVAQIATFVKCKADPLLSGKSFRVSLEAGNDTPWKFSSTDNTIPSAAPLASSTTYDTSQLAPKELLLFKQALNDASEFKRKKAEEWTGQKKSSTLTILGKLIDCGLIIQKGHSKDCTYSVAPPSTS